jgi:glutathione S-transferase
MQEVNILAGEQFEDWYRKLNPNCVVPTLIHDGVPICESAVICEYLEDEFPQSPMRPRDSVGRSKMRIWAKDVDSYMQRNIAAVTFPATHRFEVLKLSPEERQAFYDGRAASDPYHAAQKKSWIEDGYQSDHAQRSIFICDSFYQKMEAQLSATPWLAGDEYTIADAAALPYIVRLEMLNYLGWLEMIGTHVLDWYARSKARGSFMPAFYDVMSGEYLEKIRMRGNQAWPEFKVILEKIHAQKLETRKLQTQRQAAKKQRAA